MNRKLMPDDLVYIDPVHGWHYHTKKCWMSGNKAIKLKDLRYFKPFTGRKFIPCGCIDAYENGKELKQLLAKPIIEDVII